METDYKNNIGKRLKYAREKKGLQQKFVAQKLGVVSATLSRIEAGLHEPDSEKIKLLCELYEVSPQWVLFGGELHDKEMTLTERELKLLSLYNQLSDEAKQWLFDTLEIIKLK